MERWNRRQLKNVKAFYMSYKFICFVPLHNTNSMAMDKEKVRKLFNVVKTIIDIVRFIKNVKKR